MIRDDRAIHRHGVASLHYDISAVLGEEVVLFTLAESPLVREGKKK